jgi:sulfonate transport system ATP-binding protein
MAVQHQPGGRGTSHQPGTAAATLGCANLHHYFATANSAQLLPALRDISLDIPAGSFVSLVGASGCGKSTLLRVFAGLIQPTHGTATLAGRPIRGADEHKGMVFQEDAVFPWLSVVKNVEYGLRVRGVPRAERRAIADQWIDLVGLRGFEHAYPRELSGGMRKRVDLARVYASDPDVLLMDEPFGALDAQTKLRLQRELLQLWERRRKTVLFVTHDLEEAVYLSDTVVVMAARPGRIAATHRVGLGRPRPLEVRMSAEFGALTRQLWEEIESLDMHRTPPSGGG